MKPNGMGAATIYVVTLINNEKRIQGKIAKVSNVTEVTIRNQYKKILDKLSIDINF